MAKALFGHVALPAQILVDENAALRARVRRLERELAELRAERDDIREAAREAAIAHELMTLTGDQAEPALA